MIWAIADTHLSINGSKPMDVFGPAWERHAERLEQHWRELVSPGDVVILPGDISWGMNLNEARADLQFLHELPGEKYISRGNHDYWWTSLQKLERFAEEQGWEDIHFMRLGAYEVVSEGERVLLFGTRGWTLENDKDFTADDRKILAREEVRLETAIQAMEEQYREGTKLICVLHYPPLLRSKRQTGFTRRLEAAGVPLCLYGHLHGRGAYEAFEGESGGVLYLNVAADRLEMKPRLLPLLNRLPSKM